MAARVSANHDLVELGDIDELARHADRLAAGGHWDDLDELRDLCRKALDRGKQLWPISARAEYLLALDAPGPWAARVLVDGAGRFTPGPLAEVAACNHGWDDIAPYLEPLTPSGAVFAHERVLRDEDLRDDDRVAPDVLELPLALARWEPSYPLACYEADRADFPFDGLTPDRLSSTRLPRAGTPIDDSESIRALRDLAGAWTNESNGRSEAVAVRGSAASAIARLGVGGTLHVGEISPSEAMATVAWTAASGGAHGRRRGMAAGRFAAWWTIAALTGMLDDWPVDEADLGDAASELRWYVWDAGAPTTGWSCRLAIEDPADGFAWALSATDAALL